MRLFIGLFPPKETLDDLRDAVRKFAKEKRNLKYIPIDQLHITIKYIGNKVTEKSYETIFDELDRIDGNLGGPQTVEIKNLAFGFPRDTFPKYLMANVKASSDLKFVAEDLHGFIKDLKLRDTFRWKKTSQYDFHVTLARLKNTATRSTAKNIQGMARTMHEFEFTPFEATDIYLVESVVNRDKSVTYKKLKKISL